jgi:ABC-2 type transport system permease protein
MTGFATLLYKELLRFWKVSFQTMAAPVLTALLYLLIFAHALEGRVNVYQDVSYTAFLVPGLVMMSVLQNSFANSSSSLIQSKITGNLVFVLLAPVSYVEFFWAYVLASMARAMAVGLGVLAAGAWFVPLRSPSRCSAAHCSARLGWWRASGPSASTSWPGSRISSSCR